MSIRAKVELHW